MRRTYLTYATFPLTGLHHTPERSAEQHTPDSCVRSLSSATHFPRHCSDTVTALCRFTAHGDFMPSSSFRITSDPTANLLMVEKANHELATYDPRRLTGVSVYREIGRDFSVGDRIQFTAPDKSLGVANHDLAIIGSLRRTGGSQPASITTVKLNSTPALIVISTTVTPSPVILRPHRRPSACSRRYQCRYFGPGQSDLRIRKIRRALKKERTRILLRQADGHAFVGSL